LEKAGHRCSNPWCRSNRNLTVHHVDKRGPDGACAFDQLNLVVLCRACHAKTHHPELTLARRDLGRWPPTPD
jgi:hypothetical protein